MQKLKIIKSISGIVVSSGVGTVVGNAVGMTTPANLTRYQKVMVTIGGASLASLVGSMAASHVDDAIDEIAAIFQPAQDEPKNEIEN